MNGSIQLRAHAKINLYLDVLGKRPDGYHNLETVFQSIRLHDEVEIRAAGNRLSVWCDHPQVPQDDTNIAMRAARRLLEHAEIERGFEIQIEKRIPVAAGLAGGSADAAAVLVGLNELLDLGYSQADLQQIGAQIGADVPFSIQGGTALGHGIGEQLSPLKMAEHTAVVLANPGIAISTGWAFGQLNFGLTASGKNVTILVQGLEVGNWLQVANSLYNVFQPIVVLHYPVVGELLEQLNRESVRGALMTGSGPTVFGLVPDSRSAHKILESLSPPYGLVTETCSQGVHVL